MAKSFSTPSSSSNQNQTPKKPLLSVKTPSYTSLRDVLPFSAAAVNSPAAIHHQVSIRNRLVNQAAWAYLQPMSTSPSCPSGPPFFRRLHNRIFPSPTRRNPLGACLTFIHHTLLRILHAIPRFLRVIQE